MVIDIQSIECLVYFAMIGLVLLDFEGLNDRWKWRKNQWKDVQTLRNIYVLWYWCCCFKQSFLIFSYNNQLNQTFKFDEKKIIPGNCGWFWIVCNPDKQKKMIRIFEKKNLPCHDWLPKCWLSCVFISGTWSISKSLLYKKNCLTNLLDHCWLLNAWFCCGKSK